MSLCMPYVCIVSLRVFACISTWALGILKTCFINEPQIDKVTVKHYKTLYKWCILCTFNCIFTSDSNCLLYSFIV